MGQVVMLKHSRDFSLSVNAVALNSKYASCTLTLVHPSYTCGCKVVLDFRVFYHPNVSTEVLCLMSAIYVKGCNTSSQV